MQFARVSKEINRLLPRLPFYLRQPNEIITFVMSYFICAAIKTGMSVLNFASTQGVYLSEATDQANLKDYCNEVLSDESTFNRGLKIRFFSFPVLL